MSDWIIDEVIFQCPFTCFLGGPAGAGKTTILQQILINKKALIDKQPQRIVLCYKNNQSAYDVFKLLDVPVEFIQGTPDDLIFDSTINNILIIDDLMTECKDNSNVSSYFTRRSHHENISVFFLSQNILMQGKCARDISLNSSYMILFNNPRDKQQIKVLGSQMFPKKALGFIEIFEDAIKSQKGRGYLFLDFKQNTAERMRIQTGIIPGEERLIYTLR